MTNTDASLPRVSPGKHLVPFPSSGKRSMFGSSVKDGSELFSDGHSSRMNCREKVHTSVPRYLTPQAKIILYLHSIYLPGVNII